MTPSDSELIFECIASISSSPIAPEEFCVWEEKADNTSQRPRTRSQRAERSSDDLQTQTATPPTSSRQGRIAAPPPFPQPDVTRLHTREQADAFYKARTRWLQFYAESHPQLIPRTQHNPPVTTENIYNEDDFEEYAAEGEPIPSPTPQILPTAPNPSSTYTMSNATTPKPTMIGKIDDFDGTPDKAQRWISSTDLHFDINDTIYTSDKKKVIMVYQKAIRPPLLRRALTGKELVTIEDWMNTVANLDANWISANAISEGTWGARNKERQYNKNCKSGPSTSVKRLTKDEEETRRKEGRCFICNEKGHIGRNCRNKGKTPERKVRQTETEDDVKTVVEEDRVQNIMRMWRELGEDQKAEAMKELEDEGF
ncbi:hypothetical protein SERLA73DRAFT_70893 [Serpula lacrymans var. lacrymans S7.3]|uniref:CCHC-type domain-containing protein n=1 Tax=Serpula lacrymans var. lacrymans (strain S7.3) TaxID=936435 RepID=F8PNJ8_SERL3|nr:hypothetical protein SERLA73DRAFT_70893 [Serpula lacrymans var. lacrymans S7.3]